ncbi:MAG: hypothetical protein LBJ88_01210 [Campylobacteraceae bacterium]|jgi:hypothetical protein|nr:hypothetical protein [Campylobacteraceae bacterium]
MKDIALAFEGQKEELKKEYDKYKNGFDIIKEELEKRIVNTEYYKGVFYEIFPFSYQRAGLKQGKPIENKNHIKSSNDLYAYSFDKKNNIIEVKHGISIEGEFYYQFLFHENDRVKSMNFDNRKTLQNVSLYFFNSNNKIAKSYLKGRRGSRGEEYHYNKGEILEKITIRQFDRNDNEADTLFHSFEYNFDGSLKSITKSALNNNNYSEIIYLKK